MALHKRRERAIERAHEASGLNAAWDQDTANGDALAALEDAFAAVPCQTAADLEFKITSLDPRGWLETTTGRAQIVADVRHLVSREAGA